MTEPLIKLKPCPFCGQDAVIYREGNYHWVRCPHCDAAGPTDLGNSGACEAWNTRPVEAQLLEACKKLINYRDHNVLNFQLEKADDFIHMMRIAIAAAEGELWPIY